MTHSMRDIDNKVIERNGNATSNTKGIKCVFSILYAYARRRHGSVYTVFNFTSLFPSREIRNLQLTNDSLKPLLPLKK